VGTFRMLHTLLFVHGFWSYQRVTTLVNIIFYKASMVAITMYYFGFFSGFSGTQFFNDAPYQLYNVVFTALPVIATAVLDRSLPAKLLENTPEAYQQNKGTLFGPWIFTRWIIRAVLHSLCIFFVPVLAMDQQFVARSDGLTHDLWYTSTICYYCVVLLPTLIILFEMQSQTIVHYISIGISLVTLFLFVYLINVFRTLDSDLYGVINRLYGTASAWLIIIITVAIPLIVEGTFRAFKRHLRPTYTQILQEYWNRSGKLQYGRQQDLRDLPRRMSGAAALSAAQLESKRDLRPIATTPKSPAREDRQREQVLDKLKSMDKKLTERKERNVNVGAGLQSAVIQSMLRFRNLTGSQFDSAAQARFMVHGGGGGDHDTKHPDVKSPH